MKKFALGVGIVVVLLLVFVGTRPGTYHVERSTTIAAPAEEVHARLDDFHQWDAWSPWEKMDPQMKKSFDGPAAGVGASYHWAGNDDVGEGRMTILESVPGEKVGIKLEFLKPFTATSTTTFALSPDAGGTRVVWTMDGTNNFLAKAFSIFMPMDKTVGGDFERGLAQLKVVAEAASAGPGAEPDPSGGQGTAAPPAP